MCCCLCLPLLLPPPPSVSVPWSPVRSPAPLASPPVAPCSSSPNLLGHGWVHGPARPPWPGIPAPRGEGVTGVNRSNRDDSLQNRPSLAHKNLNFYLTIQLNIRDKLNLVKQFPGCQWHFHPHTLRTRVLWNGLWYSKASIPLTAAVFYRLQFETLPWRMLTFQALSFV